MKNVKLLLSVFLFLFISCQKRELPIQKADRGTAITSSFYWGPKYATQTWFKLNGNKIVSQNSRGDWDLEFEAGTGNHVRLNAAKFMFALNTHKQTFAEVKDTSSFNFYNTKQCDRVATLDSSVMGVFENHSPVYIIDLGVDDNNMPLGLKKFQFLENKNASFTFCYANLDGSDSLCRYFSKSDNYNFVQFSFKTNQLQSNIEPQKKDFDLEFTQYTYIFENPYVPYWVCGVLLNRSEVKACKIDDKAYETINLSDTLQHPLTNRPDAIGYDWKKWDFTLARYSYPAFSYIIKDSEGFYFKLRFLTFENDLGQKGYPTFEFQKL